jgi:hypothetical protein
MTVGSFNQTCTTCETLLNGGVLDPPAIDIEGGVFGGDGAVDGPVTLTDGSTLQAGDPLGQLQFSGDYTQTGGDIDFNVESGGSGGFLESTLNFFTGSNVSIDDADVIFNFAPGADPGAFETDGLFNIDTFFTDNGVGFYADFGDVFSGDTFTVDESGVQVETLTLDASNGNLDSAGASPTPEPGTLLLLLSALGVLGYRAYRSRDQRS